MSFFFQTFSPETQVDKQTRFQRSYRPRVWVRAKLPTLGKWFESVLSGGRYVYFRFRFFDIGFGFLTLWLDGGQWYMDFGGNFWKMTEVECERGCECNRSMANLWIVNAAWRVIGWQTRTCEMAEGGFLVSGCWPLDSIGVRRAWESSREIARGVYREDGCQPVSAENLNSHCESWTHSETFKFRV